MSYAVEPVPPLSHCGGGMIGGQIIMNKRFFMFRFFKKREEIFNKLIQEQAAVTFEGLKLLVKYLETPSPEIAEQ